MTLLPLVLPLPLPPLALALALALALLPLLLPLVPLPLLSHVSLQQELPAQQGQFITILWALPVRQEILDL